MKIWVDADAAGYGWFVDATPLADEEFTPAEDGTLQACLAAAGIPFVGSDAAASALAFDKVRAKQLFRFHGIDHLIDARHPLEVRVETIHEQGVEHVTGNLRETRVTAWLRGRRCRIRGFVAYADDQNAIRAEVNGWAQWCGLRFLPAHESSMARGNRVGILQNTQSDFQFSSTTLVDQRVH